MQLQVTIDGSIFAIDFTGTLDVYRMIDGSTVGILSTGQCSVDYTGECMAPVRSPFGLAAAEKRVLQRWPNFFESITQPACGGSAVRGGYD